MTMTKGLEGVVATTSSISSIEDGVLTYRGYNIDDLATHTTYEEVVHLLWYARLPTIAERTTLVQQLSDQAAIAPEIVTLLRSFPADANAMAVLRSAVSALALFDPEAHETDPQAHQRIAIRLQAKLPTIVAAFARIRQGLEPLTPLPESTVAAQFLYLLTGEQPTETAVKALDKALVLHADHELNASTFAARVTVATLSDMYSGVTAAIGALRGPLHGGANEAVMEMLEEIGSVERVDEYIHTKLRQKAKIMGFGHRVYKDGDPRAKHLQHMSRELGLLTGNTQWYEMSVRIEQLVTGEKGLKPNVDFYSASTYTSLAIPRDLFTPIFAISRVSGWTAHILEQYANNRLIRPRAQYTGKTQQHVTPIASR
jgi:citrate synthase